MTQLQTIKTEIERRKKEYRNSDNLQDVIRYDTISKLLSFIDSLEKEPQGFDEAAEEYANGRYMDTLSQQICAEDFKAGAKRVAEQIKNEIERRRNNAREWSNKAKYHGPHYHKMRGIESGCDAILSFIESLEKAEQE